MGPKTRFFGLPTPKIGGGCPKTVGEGGVGVPNLGPMLCQSHIYIYIYVYIYGISLLIYPPPYRDTRWPGGGGDPPPPIFGVLSPKKHVSGPVGASREALRAS